MAPRTRALCGSSKMQKIDRYFETSPQDRIWISRILPRRLDSESFLRFRNNCVILSIFAVPKKVEHFRIFPEAPAKGFSHRTNAKFNFSLDLHNISYFHLLPFHHLHHLITSTSCTSHKSFASTTPSSII